MSKEQPPKPYIPLLQRRTGDASSELKLQVHNSKEETSADDSAKDKGTTPPHTPRPEEPQSSPQRPKEQEESAPRTAPIEPNPDQLRHDLQVTISKLGEVSTKALPSQPPRPKTPSCHVTPSEDSVFSGESPQTATTPNPPGAAEAELSIDDFLFHSSEGTQASKGNQG